MIPRDKEPYRFYCLEYIDSYATWRRGTDAATTILYIPRVGWKRLARWLPNGRRDGQSESQSEKETGREK